MWQYYNGNEYALLLKSAQMPWKIEKVSYKKVSFFLSLQTNPVPSTFSVYPNNLSKI